MNAVAEAVLPATQPAIASPEPVQQVILHGVSWETYARLLIEHEGSSGTRFTYDQGELEIMVLSAKHEAMKHLLSLLVEIVAEELKVDVCGFGSTTFRREDLARGFEPDACFYVEHAELMRGKDEIDLTVDPPPDLVIEIDITSLSLNKFPIFAAVGVSEVWRYDGDTWTIFTLKQNKHRVQATSTVLPGVTGQMLTQFMAEGKTLTRSVWLRRLREWVRTRQTQRKTQS
jgi:Uma2 family endonuclease